MCIRDRFGSLFTYFTYICSINALFDLLRNEVFLYSKFLDDDIYKYIYTRIRCYQLDNLFNNVFPISDGDFAIVIPDFSIILIFSSALPFPPDIIAPA